MAGITNITDRALLPLPQTQGSPQTPLPCKKTPSPTSVGILNSQSLPGGGDGAVLAQSHSTSETIDSDCRFLSAGEWRSWRLLGVAGFAQSIARSTTLACTRQYQVRVCYRRETHACSRHSGSPSCVPIPIPTFPIRHGSTSSR